MQSLQIGITGGIGSGKSIVCKIFNSLGAPVYDADSRAKRVMTTDGILISQIKKEFGELSYHPDGSLNRSRLSEEVFQNPSRLNALNELVHPRVALDYETWRREHLEFSYVIKEAALLFESGSYKLLDCVIVITAPEELRIERVRNRDKGRSVEQIKNIVAQQWSEAEKIMKSNAIILNDESKLVIPQVLRLHELFQQGKIPEGDY
jgi:dephospho-CoA kinase